MNSLMKSSVSKYGWKSGNRIISGLIVHNAYKSKTEPMNMKQISLHFTFSTSHHLHRLHLHNHFVSIMDSPSL